MTKIPGYHPNLKQGKFAPDPHKVAKENGGGFTNSAKYVERHKTPQSSRPADGGLNDKPDSKGPMTHRPINPAAKPNTWTRSGVSHRPGDKSD
jgi:hypothetical protein